MNRKLELKIVLWSSTHIILCLYVKTIFLNLLGNFIINFTGDRFEHIYIEKER